ncbi:MAG TPA: hypothetical protein VF772_10415 [Terriglobales bacterium]
MSDAAQIRTVVVPSAQGLKATSSVTLVLQVADEITPEIVAVVQAAANEFLGKRVRILSIKILPDSKRDFGRWLQRGRDTIQASHNAVQQRR